NLHRVCRQDHRGRGGWPAWRRSRLVPRGYIRDARQEVAARIRHLKTLAVAPHRAHLRRSEETNASRSRSPAVRFIESTSARGGDRSMSFTSEASKSKAPKCFRGNRRRAWPASDDAAQ